MKKKLFLGMAALLGMSLAFTACSNDDDPAGAAVNDNAIGFSVLTNNAAGTRATAITPSNYKELMTNFKVWGYYTDGGAYYLGDDGDNGIVFKGSNGVFDYAQSTDLHYWPNGKALNFYAISPASNDNLTFESGPSLTYVVPANQTEQIDLMQAHTEGVTKPSNGKADLKFNHLLSQVLFKAKTASTTLEVEINSITIHNVYNTGDYKTSDYNNPETWGNAYGTRTDYKVGLASAVTVPTTGEAVSATDADGVLMLIPQTIVAKDKGTKTSDADAAGKTYIEVEATEKVKNSDGTYTYLLGSASGPGKTYIPLGQVWNVGKKYTYTLVFGGKNGGGEDPNGDPTLTPIDFEVGVTDWTNAWAEDSTAGDINL